MSTPGYVSLIPISPAVPDISDHTTKGKELVDQRSPPNAPATGSAKPRDTSVRSQRAKFFATLSKEKLNHICENFLTEAQRQALTTNASGKELDEADDAAILAGITASLTDLTSTYGPGHAQNQLGINVTASTPETLIPEKMLPDHSALTSITSPITSEPVKLPKLDAGRAMGIKGSETWHIERQRDAHCGLHAVNAVLNQPYFSKSRLKENIDEHEKTMGPPIEYESSNHLDELPTDALSDLVQEPSGWYTSDALCLMLNRALQDVGEDDKQSLEDSGMPRRFEHFYRNNYPDKQWDSALTKLKPMGNSVSPTIKSFIILAPGHYIACRWINNAWRDLNSIGDATKFMSLENRRIENIQDFVRQKNPVSLIIDEKFIN